MTYTTTGVQFDGISPHTCSLVVFLCTSEAFLGLLFAGMCGAILFGKVNRVQSHAKLIFSNALCLQYDEVDPDEMLIEDEEDDHDDCSEENEDDDEEQEIDHDEENPMVEAAATPTKAVRLFALFLGSAFFLWILTSGSPFSVYQAEFVEQYNGCPVLKFQVVNEVSFGA